jgi:hypothetical protein
VKSAFLNGDLHEELFVEQPAGFVKPGSEHLVLHLHKALYGLNQAPWAWNEKLDQTLMSLGFLRCPSEPAIYTRRRNGSRLIIGVYVDDLVVAGELKKVIESFKSEMGKAFNMSDLGLLQYYLGLEVKQNSDGIFLSQGAYAKKILDRSGMAGCNPCQFPMEPHLKLSKGSLEQAVDKTMYRSIVGSLRYLVNTRPNIAFAVGYVSQLLEDPCNDHLAVAKHILCYVAGTCAWGLWFGKKGKKEDVLTGFSDSDSARDIDKWQSTTSVIFFLGDSPITWQSIKQKVV